MAEEVGFTGRFEKFSQRMTHAVGRPRGPPAGGETTAGSLRT
jgi:hypothetical protein